MKLMLCCVHFVYRKDLNEKRKAYYNFLKTTERQYMLCQFTQEFVDMRVQIDVHDDYLRSSFERKLDEASLNLTFKVLSEEEWDFMLTMNSYLFILTARAT
jgi:hypothetical protein